MTDRSKRNCNGCGKPLSDASRTPCGHWRRTCSDACASKAIGEGQRRISRVRRERKAARVAKLEAERIAKGEPAPTCGVCDKPIVPAFTLDGTLRSVCSNACSNQRRSQRADVRTGEAPHHGPSWERRQRKALAPLSVVVFKDTNFRAKRVCDTCCDMSWRRPPAGCRECGLPFGEERPGLSKATCSALGDAVRWAP